MPTKPFIRDWPRGHNPGATSYRRYYMDPFDDIWSDQQGVMGSPDFYSPKMDIDETEDAYLITFDVPGVKSEDLHVEIENNVLTISGRRERRVQTERGGQPQVEREYGSFTRSITLPQSSDSENVEAHLHDGVLEVAVAKARADSRKRVEIRTGEGGLFKKLMQSESGETHS